MSKTLENAATRSHGGNLELDPAFCWQAVYSRDRRFDGRFFAGITTTQGVYCRSILSPSLLVLPTTSAGFHSAAAAERRLDFVRCANAATLTRHREVLRGLAPGQSSLMRSLSISPGERFNDGNLEQLADRGGIGSRHLRRPLPAPSRCFAPEDCAIAPGCRIARNLIAETDLSPMEVAKSTGFASIRQFNHSVKTTFGQSPTDLRRPHRSSSAGRPRQTGVIVYLPYRMPFDWSCVIQFLSSKQQRRASNLYR